MIFSLKPAFLGDSQPRLMTEGISPDNPQGVPSSKPDLLWGSIEAQRKKLHKLVLLRKRCLGLRLQMGELSNTRKVLPSGKRLQNDGKSPCSMRKSTISMAMFNSELLVYQRVLQFQW